MRLYNIAKEIIINTLIGMLFGFLFFGSIIIIFS